MRILKTRGAKEIGWQKEAAKLALNHNLICITKPEFKNLDFDKWSPLQWFGTMIASYLSRTKEVEICNFYGLQINDIDSFCYQLGRVLPWTSDVARNGDAIYDVILNFETEPENRIFIWYEAQHLFRKNRALFEDIFGSLVVAGYLNTIGKGTYNYRVNQKNVFLFDDIDESELDYLLEKAYYTPRVDANYVTLEAQKAAEMKHEFIKLMIK